MVNDLELCTDGFHSDECPGCGLTADERDDPAFEVIGAMNFGDGVNAERDRIAEAVRGIDPDAYADDGDAQTALDILEDVLAIVDGL